MQRYPYGTVNLVIDCADLQDSATFWCELLGYRAEGEGDGHYLSLVPAAGPGIELLLQQVPDHQIGKNRLHLDLRTANLADEVDRALAAGARVVTTEPLSEDGWTWHVLADPDGHEFCVLQPPGVFDAPES